MVFFFPSRALAPFPSIPPNQQKPAAFLTAQPCRILSPVSCWSRALLLLLWREYARLALLIRPIAPAPFCSNEGSAAGGAFRVQCAGW